MGFIWAETIAIGGNIQAADVEELRINTDWIKNNLVCLAHNTTYRSTHFNNDDVGHNATYNATHNTTIQTTNDSNERATHDSSVLTAHKSGDLASHYDQNYTTHQIGYDVTYNATIQTTINATNWGAAQTTYRVGDYSSVNGTYDAANTPTCTTHDISHYTVYNNVYFSSFDVLGG